MGSGVFVDAVTSWRKLTKKKKAATRKRGYRFFYFFRTQVKMIYREKTQPTFECPSCGELVDQVFTANNRMESEKVFWCRRCNPKGCQLTPEFWAKLECKRACGRMDRWKEFFPMLKTYRKFTGLKPKDYYAARARWETALIKLTDQASELGRTITASSGS